MESIKHLAAALIAAQNEMPQLYNTENNPYFKSKYAPLSEVQNTCLPILRKHGIAVMQGTDSKLVTNEHGPAVMVIVKTTFCHADSGESWTESIGMIPAKQDPQGVGSAITYGRRYLLTTMAGLASEDDDGNSASNTNGHQQRQPAPKRQPPKVSASTLQEMKEVADANELREQGLDFTLNDVPETPFDNRPTMREQRQQKQSDNVAVQEGAGEFYATLSEDMDFLGQVEKRAQDMMMYLRKKHSESDNPMSEKQYQYMSGLLDTRYGKDMHTVILSFLFGEAISSDNAPGWKVPGNDKFPGLLQWLINPDEHEAKITLLDHVAAVLIESMKELA